MFPSTFPPQTLINAGENHLGTVGGHMSIVEAEVVMTTHANYLANDFVGEDATALIFLPAARVNGGTGLIVSAVLIDKSMQSKQCELWLFDEDVTPPADSAAWTLSDADMEHLVGIIPFITYYASAANSVSVVNPVSIGFRTAAVGTRLFGCVVTRDAPVYASGDLLIRLAVIQD
jgi:hypothetical protein